ncbi:hypothetical protein [Veronia nyctiphanis]|nr:hypothetical protein [Veronia nyctiphanis]
MVTTLGVVGSLGGSLAGKALPQQAISRVFAIFLLGLSGVTAINQIGG